MSTVRGNKSYSLVRYVLAGCGWFIVFFEWIHVSYQAPGRDEITLIVVLIPSLVLIHAAAKAWIMHSKRLAVRGKRGLVTRYTSPAFSHDRLGRQLIMDEAVSSSREIVIAIDGEAKSYKPAEETSLLGLKPDASVPGEVKQPVPASEVWG